MVSIKSKDRYWDSGIKFNSIQADGSIRDGVNYSGDIDVNTYFTKNSEDRQKIYLKNTYDGRKKMINIE
jgi:hypothetical protein